jgi:hypothetical protein
LHRNSMRCSSCLWLLRVWQSMPKIMMYDILACLDKQHGSGND